MKKNYSAIIFDLGNTIIKFDHTIAVRRLADKFTIDPVKAYNLFFDSDLTQIFEKGKISPEEFCNRASDRLGINLMPRDFFDIWNNIFWEDKDSCALVRELKGRYKLFLLSNVNKSHFEYIREKFDIISLFDELILSFMVGVMKPDRAIYEDAIRRAGGDSTKLLYIDDREELVEGAKRVGIDSIRYEGADKLRGIMLVKGIL